MSYYEIRDLAEQELKDRLGWSEEGTAELTTSVVMVLCDRVAALQSEVKALREATDKAVTP